MASLAWHEKADGEAVPFTFVYDETGPVVLGRKDMVDMLGDRYTAAWTRFDEIGKTKFDAAMKKKKAASEAAAARRREGGF